MITEDIEDNIYGGSTVSLLNPEFYETARDEESLSINLQEAGFHIRLITPFSLDEGDVSGFIIDFSHSVNRATLSASDFTMRLHDAKNNTSIEGSINSLTWINDQQLSIEIQTLANVDIQLGLRDHAEIKNSADNSQLSLASIKNDPIENYTLLFDSLVDGNNPSVESLTSIILTDFTLDQPDEALHINKDTSEWYSVALEGEGILQLHGDNDLDLIKKLSDSRLTHGGEGGGWEIEIAQETGSSGFSWHVGSENNGYTSLTYSDGVDSYVIEVDTGTSSDSLTLTIL